MATVTITIRDTDTEELGSANISVNFDPDLKRDRPTPAQKVALSLVEGLANA